jgi:hypothetical protein
MTRFRSAGLFSLVAIGALGTAAARDYPSIATPMTAAVDVKKKIGDALELRVFGDAGYFQVEVKSRRRLHGCFDNLAYAARHGPDPSTIMPWHTTGHYFPDTRVVPLCGVPYDVVISIVAPQVSCEGDRARFVDGTLTVSARPR